MRPADAAFRLLRGGDDRLARFLARGADRSWRGERLSNGSVWFQNAANAPDILSLLEERCPDGATTELWGLAERELAQIVRSVLPWDLLRAPLLQATMLTRGWRRQAAELRVLRSTYSADPAADASSGGSSRLPDARGAGAVDVAHGRASPRAPTRFSTVTGTDPYSLDYIVEWGGGYGQLAHMLRRGKQPPTHVIVDLPAVAALQWTWLSTVVGSTEVHTPVPAAGAPDRLHQPDDPGGIFPRQGTPSKSPDLDLGAYEAPASVQDQAAGMPSGTAICW